MYTEIIPVMGMGATNADGVAEIVYARKEFKGFRPAMIIAKTAEDLIIFLSMHEGIHAVRGWRKKKQQHRADAFILRNVIFTGRRK